MLIREKLAVYDSKDYASVMRCFLIILMAVFLFGSQSYAEVYRWVDSAGKISYSDKPQPGAEEIEIDVAPSISDTKAISDAEPPEEDEKSEKINYKIKILTPENDESLRDNAGNVSIMLKVTPKLDPEKGDMFLVYLDGVASLDKQSGLFFTMQNIDRGTHNLRVELVSPDEQVLASTSSVFHLKRYSVQHKNN